MTHLNIGNESINTKEIKKIISGNIAHFESKIARLNMNSRIGVCTLSFYARLIQEQRVILEWVERCELAQIRESAAA